MAQKMMSGRMMRSRGMPAAFMERSSYFSPKLPNVIKAANRMASGSERGIRVSAE